MKRILRGFKVERAVLKSVLKAIRIVGKDFNIIYDYKVGNLNIDILLISADLILFIDAKSKKCKNDRKKLSYQIYKFRTQLRDRGLNAFNIPCKYAVIYFSDIKDIRKIYLNLRQIVKNRENTEKKRPESKTNSAMVGPRGFEPRTNGL